MAAQHHPGRALQQALHRGKLLHHIRAVRVVLDDRNDPVDVPPGGLQPVHHGSLMAIHTGIVPHPRWGGARWSTWPSGVAPRSRRARRGILLTQQILSPYGDSIVGGAGARVSGAPGTDRLISRRLA